MAINTLITIKDAITAFADGHGQLQGRVIFEADDHRSAYITEENTYPLLFVAPIDVAVNRAMNVHTLRVYVYERINDDRLDVWENANDTSLILRDIRVWWNDYGVDDINIVEDPIGQFGCDKELDNLVGYYADIRFEIPSHGRCQVPVDVTPIPAPTCEDAVQVIEDSQGNELYSNSIPSGATETQVIQDSTAVLKDTSGATISTTSILAEGSEDIIAPNSTYLVEYVNGTDIQSGSIVSGGSVTVTVPNPIVCADTTIEVNGTPEGTFTAGSTIDVQLSDSGGVVTPTSVTVVGNDVQVLLPDSVAPVDPDVTAFLTATGITDPTIKSAIEGLVYDLKRYSLWTKMDAVYPIVGGTAATHKFNLKNPLDTDGAFRITFSGGWVHSSTGITGNGTNTYGDTHFNVSTGFTTTNGSYGFSLAVNKASGSSYDFGASTGGFGIALYPTDRYFMFGGAFSLVAGTATLGFYAANRVTGNTEGYKDGVRIMNTTVASTLPNSNLVIGAASTIPQSPSIGQYDFAFISETLTQTEHAQLDSIVELFNTFLGR